jgi:hypothetical protein
MKSRYSDVCVICGTNPKTGRDHLPPKSIFPKPRPSDLIRVPACDSCNMGRSGLDEEFKVSIGLQAGHGEEGERLFCEQTSRTLSHNQRLKAELLSSIKEVELKTPEGILLGTAQAVPLRSESYDKVINTIIRGLHWHHSGQILGDLVDIKVGWHRYLTKEIVTMTNNWAAGIVGNGQFIYKFAIFDEVPLASVWVLQFFGQSWSSGTVTPKTGP